MRTVRLALDEQGAATTTDLVVAAPRAHLALRLDGVVDDVTTARVDAHHLDGEVLRFDGLAAGARVTVRGRVDFGTTPYGLARLVDRADGRAYVIGSGALGGAPRLAACEDGPDDRMPTMIVLDGARGRALATGRPRSPRRFVSPIPLASHQIGLAAGPWRRYADGPVSVLARQALPSAERVTTLLADTSHALRWVAAWFGGPPPNGPSYGQVLVPDPPWLAMEHPGCVLVSERLLETERGSARGRRVTVLAHEVAHQWVGNLVSPRRWEDVGVLEGLAELIGQLACEELLGTEGRPFLEERRTAGPLAARRNDPDASTAGLAEVAGPAQHAELFREARSELGAEEFRDRVRALCAARAGRAVSASEVWELLGLDDRQPARIRLPRPEPQPGVPLDPWRGLGELDPATACRRAREVFRAAPPGGARVRAALASVHDPRVAGSVAAGLGAELARGLGDVVRRPHLGQVFESVRAED